MIIVAFQCVDNAYCFKGRVQCFSMQAVMNKHFSWILKIKLAQIRLVIFEKNSKTARFYSEKWRHQAS